MKKYFYLSKNKAIKGIALVHEISEEPILGYKEHFRTKHNLDVVEFRGEDLPHYITYDEASGKIREATNQEKYDRNEYILKSSEYIEDGIIKEKPLPDPSILNPVWEANKWIETATLDEFREAKRLEMKHYRDNINNSPFEYKGWYLDADEDSRSKMFKVQAAFKDKPEMELNWITADNSVADLTIGELDAIIVGLAVREQELFSHFISRLQIINTTETIEAIKQIKW